MRCLSCSASLRSGRDAEARVEFEHAASLARNEREPLLARIDATDRHEPASGDISRSYSGGSASAWDSSARELMSSLRYA